MKAENSLTKIQQEALVAAHDFIHTNSDGAENYEEFSELRRILLTINQAAAPTTINLLEEIKAGVVSFLRSKPDAPYLTNGDKTWSSHELATEVESGTLTGREVIQSMILLTADRVLRGKEQLST